MKLRLDPVIARARRHAPKAALAAGALALGAGGALCVEAVRAAALPITRGVDLSQVRAALRLRLPHTPIDAIDCGGPGGLCEIVAGASLFYVDRAARYLVIGHVYDMEARSDLTASRLLALNPAKLIPAAAQQADNDAGDGPPSPQATARRVNLAELPPAGGIVWGDPAGKRLVVLSDFACGYCRKLTAELAPLGLRIEERPISIFGARSRALSEAVLCASDPVSALHDAYRDKPVGQHPRCDTRGLDANEAFARRHGFGGTPVMIRADGAVLEGYRPAAVIKAFVEGAAA